MNKDKFEFIEHTADVKFIAYGDSIEEAFKNSVLAYTTVMTTLAKVKDKDKIEIAIQSKKHTSLLYDFLTELIFYLDTRGFIPKEVSKLNITADLKLTATIKGQFIKNINELDIHSYIKSVTYNEMIVDLKENKVQVVLDI